MQLISTLKFAPVLLALVVSTAGGQRSITTPRQQFGHDIGEDYFLANYVQLTDYWKKLDRQSNRMKVVQIGKTAEGRTMLMSIITAPENFTKLARYQDIAARLARAEGLTDAQARALAKEGKAVVWIDGGLHATEVLGAQQLVQWVYEMVSRNDAETQRFLRDVILLAVPANPDGMDLVSDWYMRNPAADKRSTAGVPRLYQKYAGHDNNRDSYMASQPETQAMDSILFRAWYPQIMYNHHQTGPAGTIMFAPPFRDPFNYNLDPMIPVGIDLVGAAMHNRFVAEGKPGTTMRGGANYSTWWNGGLRTTVYYHNMIGLLTETIGHPTPMEVAFVPDRMLPSGNTPFPIMPQKWRFAQSLAYELTANRAVMDVASKYREDFLYNIYRMGRNSIERGKTDTWTLTPNRVAAVKAAVEKNRTDKVQATPAQYLEVLRDRAARDPRAYIIPSDQPDFGTASRFVNALVKNGITIDRATQSFAANGRTYPAGSYVVMTAQAFRPHVLDMFEPQNHPDDIPYPGGPPTPPYDNAGWTLAYLMGVKFDRILDPFTGPFEKLAGFAPVPRGAVAPSAGGTLFSLSRTTNDAFAAVNQLLAAGEDVYALKAETRMSGKALAAGTFVVRAKATTMPVLQRISAAKGLNFDAIAGVTSVDGMTKLRAPRIALWDVYGGSMPSGWTRFVLEQFDFPYQVVYANDLDAGNLNDKYDVVILPDGATLASTDSTRGFESRVQPADVPEQWRSRMGRITAAKTLPQIRAFVEKGGTLLALGDASNIGYALDLPLRNAITDSAGKALGRARYYVPGSVLGVAVDTTSEIAWGLPSRTDVYFDNSPAFRLAPGAREKGVKTVAWFDNASPLRSGWAWGQKVLDGASEIVVAPLGAGSVVLYGPEVSFRGQTHGTFRFLFNGLYYGQGGRN